MRREGYIIEEIVADRNMDLAFNTVLRGNERKESPEGRDLLADKQGTLECIKKEIIQGTFKVTEYKERDILEGGKW